MMPPLSGDKKRPMVSKTASDRGMHSTRGNVLKKLNVKQFAVGCMLTEDEEIHHNEGAGDRPVLVDLRHHRCLSLNRVRLIGCEMLGCGVRLAVGALLGAAARGVGSDLDGLGAVGQLRVGGVVGAAGQAVRVARAAS